MVNQLVYIAGYGRSGSTLLDIILGSHPLIFSAGELFNYFDDVYYGEGVFCACGKHAPEECAFWQRVQTLFEKESHDYTRNETHLITRRIEQSVYKRPFYMSRSEEEKKEYASVWGSLMGAISDVSGCSTIVDSSKSAYANVRRMRALKELVSLNVKAIHLVRDPRAVIWSFMKGGNLQRSLRAPRPFPVTRALFGWFLANLSVQSEAERAAIPIIRVRYEDLVLEPAQELQRIGRFLNLDLSSAVKRLNRHDPLEIGHGLAGNRVRRRGITGLHLDNEWIDKAPTYVRAAAWSVWPLATRYGYNFRG